MKKLIFVLLLSVTAQAAKVADTRFESSLIAISDDPETVWEPGQYICLLKDYRKKMCGDIIKVGSRGFILLIHEKYGDLQRKDTVDIIQPDFITYNKLLTLGSDLHSPFFHIQQLFHPNFSYGVMTSAIVLPKRADDRYSLGFGIIGTLNFYSHFFKGFWARLGLGVNIANTYGTDSTGQQVKQGLIEGVGLASLGFRFGIGSRVIVGLAGGAYYHSDVRTHELTISGFGVQPIGTLDLGFIF